MPASSRSTMPEASSPRCSATSFTALSRSRSWMWRSTACFAVCAAMRLKFSAGSISITSVPSGRTSRLRTSNAPVSVSSFTVTKPECLKARTYAAARAPSTVCSISSKGMPTSAQSAVSASPRLSVDGSDCDREPARDNVIPSNVNNDRRPPAGPVRLHGDARFVDRHQLALDHRLRLSGAITHVEPLAVEPSVLADIAPRSIGAWGRDFEVVRTVDELGVIDQRPGDAAHPFAVFNGDRLRVVDRDAERASGVARLVERVELVPHVVHGRFEQLPDGGYGPRWHGGVSGNT